jgi:hypothetical protein
MSWSYARLAVSTTNNPTTNAALLSKISQSTQKMVAVQTTTLHNNNNNNKIPIDVITTFMKSTSPELKLKLDLLRRKITCKNDAEITIVNSNVVTKLLNSINKSEYNTSNEGFKIHPLPDDVNMDTISACKSEIGKANKIWVLNHGLGVRQDTRIRILGVTDDTYMAIVCGTLFSPLPKSLQVKQTEKGAISLLHSKTLDVDANNKPYLGINGKSFTGRGKMNMVLMLNELALVASKELESKGSLVFSMCDARLSPKTKELSLILGAPSLEKTKSLGDLQGAHHMIWSPTSGISRVWEGFIPTNADASSVDKKSIELGVAPLMNPQTVLPSLKRLSIVLNPNTDKGKTINVADTKTLLSANPKFTNGVKLSDKGLETLEKLLMSGKGLEVVVFE